MADITVTPADVRPLPGAIIRRFKAGASSMTPGQPVYVSANDTVSLADASATTTSFCVGVIVSVQDGGTASTSGEYVDVCTLGPVTGYSTNMAANALLYVDDDAGILATSAGTKDTVVGICLNTTDLYVNPIWIDLS